MRHQYMLSGVNHHLDNKQFICQCCSFSEKEKRKYKYFDGETLHVISVIYIILYVHFVFWGVYTHQQSILLSVL